jgi:L-glutamine:scyllo-inosose aminotransferase/L-glutamine:2-deoxy-scyllo-inosose/3-amino-2,3-dideoxy-scyllo-inosose aminotransferase
LKNKTEKLAIMGGEPVRKKPWPIWPRADENTEKLLKDVLYSGRWAISGDYNGKKLYERLFSEKFAMFHNIPYCIPTTNGSSALTIALEALGVGNGMEVIMPGLTWVACASSVFGVGAIPILVDIEEDTLCISFEKAKNAINRNIAAIMIVHLYSSTADIDGFLKLSKETGIPIIEDCSQSHGAIWKGRRVGTFGKIGVFSMQNSKVLTCGEGGAAITKDKELFDLMQQFRADGRVYNAKLLKSGREELEKIGSVQGRNFCMSEFHAAVLLDRLQHLDSENEVREKNARYLGSLLNQIGGLTPQVHLDGVDKATFYQFCLRLNVKAFGNNSIEIIAKALSDELGIAIEPIYTPINKNVLYNPLSSPKLPESEKIKALYDPKRFELPISEKARKECLIMPHNILLGNKSDMLDIVDAFVKVKKSFSKNEIKNV